MLNQYAVVVAGGGLSGCCAALAAAREGQRVLLVERYGFLGGMATAGLVNPFTPYCLWNADGSLDWSSPVNAGLFSTIIGRLRELGGLAADNVTFNEELLKLVLDRLCAEYGVTVWLHSLVIACRMSGTRLASIQIASKSGLRDVTAAGFVDATGDADIAAWAGCGFEVGTADAGQPQPMTLCFRIANVDAARFRANLDLARFRNNLSTGEIDARYLAARKLGRIARNPRDSLIILNHLLDSVVHFNSTRILGRIAVRGDDLSAAEVEGREQVFEVYQFLRQEIPGFEDCHLLMSGPQIGVRESRRINGAYTLTAEDVLACTKFSDSIARGTWHIELHNPAGDGILIRRIPPREYYTIPFRSLYALGTDNLLVVGRAVSASQEAHSAIRVMPICAALGEAAGIAAGQLADGASVTTLDAASIQQRLGSHGALY